MPIVVTIVDVPEIRTIRFKGIIKEYILLIFYLNIFSVTDKMVEMRESQMITNQIWLVECPNWNTQQK